MLGSKISHQFFDPSIFYENNGEVLYTRNYEAKVLQNGVVAQQFINIQQTKVTFYYNWIFYLLETF